MAHFSARGLRLSCILVVLEISSTGFAQLVNSEWNTGNGNWNVATNWFPNDVPDNGGGITYDVEIGNRPVAAGAQVTFVPEDGSGDTISNLTVSGAADLFTNGNQVFVISQTIVDGVGSTIRIDPHTNPGSFSLDTNNLDLNNGGGISMQGGILNVDVQMEINAGSVLNGNGLVNLGDADAVVEQVFENSGLIQVSGTLTTPGTLTIQSNGVDTIDLDGATELGLVDVSNVHVDLEADSLTLIVDGPLSDAFSGTLQIGQRDTITFNDNFSMSGADVQFDGGAQTATMNGPAAVTNITSSVFTVTGDAVITNNMTFSGTANTITINNGASLTLGGTVSIPDASALALSDGASELIVNGSTTINEAAGNFNWDGNGTADSTVNGTGNLAITANQIDELDDVYGGTLNLNDGGDVSVSNTANVWTMAGTLNKIGAGTSTISGAALHVTGAINAGGTGTLNLPTTTLSSTANVNVTSRLTLGGGSVLDGATITGTGVFELEGTSAVFANTTINTATFDWDGIGTGTAHTINSGVTFTINSAAMDNDGDMDDPFSLAGSGSQLIVNNTNGLTEWTATGAINANNAGVGTVTIGGTSRLILSGANAVLNVNGNTTVSAPLTIGSNAIADIDAVRTLRFTDIGNRLAGGTITGDGLLAANTGANLMGFGAINTDIDFDGTAAIFADDGILTINGPLLDVAVIGSLNDSGILNVVNPWSSGVAVTVVNQFGGEIRGGTIMVDNANGIRGQGLVSARVINNTRLVASNFFVGQPQATHVFQTAANNNDWDGVADTGILETEVNKTLELRDNALFAFNGSVIVAAGGRVFTNGFALGFNPGSSISLTNGTYESTNSTDIGGTVTINAGNDSTIKVETNRFLSFDAGSSTTLNGNLVLQNNNIRLNSGAIFGGVGALIIDELSHAVLANGATVNVLFVNEGTVRPANENGIGSATVKDYTQTGAGAVEFELSGTLLNQFDRLQATGIAQLDGELVVELEGGFIPGLGNMFPILSTAFGVSGKFDTYQMPLLGTGNSLAVVYSANAVTLQVIAGLWGDYNGNGVVDAADYSVWRDALGGAVVAFSGADGSGNGVIDQADYDVWAGNFGASLAPSATLANAAAVPEPTAWVILALGLLLGVRRPRSNRR